MIVSSLETIIENLLCVFAQKTHGVVLEVGPYQGSKTRYLCRNQNLKVIGVDVELSNSKWAKGYDFIVGDARNLPFAAESFDAVVSFDVIEHIDNDELFVKELYRVVKKKGIVLIGTPNRHRLSHKIRRLLGKKVEYPLKIAENCIHLREYTMEELSSIVRKAGFTVTEEKPVYLGLIGIGGFETFPAFLKRYVHYLFIFCQSQ